MICRAVSDTGPVIMTAVVLAVLALLLLAIDKELQDRVRMAADYRNIGNVLGSGYNYDQRQDNYDQALEYHKKALEIHEHHQDRVGMAAAYNNIGGVLHYLGSYTQALDYYKKALEIHEQHQDRVG